MPFRRKFETFEKSLFYKLSIGSNELKVTDEIDGANTAGVPHIVIGVNQACKAATARSIALSVTDRSSALIASDG